MMQHLFSLVVMVLLVTACGSDKDAAGDMEGAPVEQGANYYGEGPDSAGNIQSGSLGELTPGTQAELVATIGDRVFFNFNSAQIRGSNKETLKRQADWLKRHPSINITIEGHADERGTREYNIALGERRANSVRDYLISQGVSANRISTISYGKEHPEYLGSNEAAWSKNRRGVTVVN